MGLYNGWRHSRRAINQRWITKLQRLQCISTLSVHEQLQEGLRQSISRHETLLQSGCKSLGSSSLRRSHQRDADYQSSIAMSLGQKNRMETAQLIADSMEFRQILDDVSVSHPGFINMRLNNTYIAQKVIIMSTLGTKPRINSNPQKIIVDFASPNMGKQLHVGHLRSSVIGDTLCNLLEFQGHHVTRISHVGDLGSAIATLLVSLMTAPEYESFFATNSIDSINLKALAKNLTSNELGRLYEIGKQRIQTDAEFKQRVDNAVLELQQIDSKANTTSDNGSSNTLLRAWKLTCHVSRESFQELFDRLKVTVNERGESTYLKLIPTVIDKLIASKLITESQGALCIFVDGEDKPPMLIRKKDQGFLYATTDLAALYSRLFGFKGVDSNEYDRLIYVTDKSQELHFRHLFQAAKLAGWATKDKILNHVPFGLVLGEDGTKLSSRKGGSVSLETLLNEAGQESKKRSIFNSANNTDDDISCIDYQAIGDAAVRYFDLAQQRERNYKFSFDKVLNLKGNSAVYLLYASARLHGILRKLYPDQQAVNWYTYLADQNAVHVLQHASLQWHPNERALALLIAQFDDEIKNSLTHLSPHFMCDYLHRLVIQFHAFYETCRVVNDPNEKPRLILCGATYIVLAKGLDLLGIDSVDRM